MIAEHGFMYQAVGAGDGEPGFIYTIGLAQRGLPEFIFVGSSYGQAVNYLRGAVRTAMAGGAVATGLAAPGTDVNPYAVPTWILDAAPKLETHALGVVTQALRLQLPGAPRLLQVVMPDMAGRFPWEDGYDWLDQEVDAPPAHGRV